ncbi:MAG: hypothetical protein H6Q56_11 [Deltaproteobacteria bacterium]|nr:hypothetical protein [Deltaproteobacteria bacterium]
MLQLRLFLLALATLALAACSSPDPGPLTGTWQSNIGTTIEFRKGETVADGATRKASFKVSGNTVTVTHTAGATKGNSVTYTLVDADNATSPNLTIKRLK